MGRKLEVELAHCRNKGFRIQDILFPQGKLQRIRRESRRGKGGQAGHIMFSCHEDDPRPVIAYLNSQGLFGKYHKFVSLTG